MPNNIKDPVVVKELEILRKKSGGILNPAKVVQHASKKRNPLYKYFEWDNTEAARKYRLHQARLLLSAVVIIPDNMEEEVYAYHSIVKDRNPDGGYRHIIDLMLDSELREELLAEALKDLKVFRFKYTTLQKLAGVFEAVDAVTKDAT